MYGPYTSLPATSSQMFDLSHETTLCLKWRKPFVYLVCYSFLHTTYRDLQQVTWALQKYPDCTYWLGRQWKQKDNNAIRARVNQIVFALKWNSSAVLLGCEQEKGNHQEASRRVELKIEKWAEKRRGEGVKVGEGLPVGSEAGWVSDQRHCCEDEDGLEGDTHAQRKTMMKWGVNKPSGLIMRREGLGKSSAGEIMRKQVTLA